MTRLPKAQRLLALGLLGLLALPAMGQSMRFFGTGDGDVDRVKIQRSSGQPADIGATDFTIEFWLRTTAGNNAGSVPEGDGNYTWINGNIFLDGDVYNRNPAFGASLTAGVVTFGVKNAGGMQATWRGTTDIRDGGWHHIAITRAQATGAVQIYVDGVREENDTAGPTGDISYPGGTPLSVCGRSGTQSCSFSDPFLVLGAEKHDAGTAYPSYFGYMTELRLSNVIRYTAASIPVPTQPSTTDGNTLALYHFDEQAGATLFDTAANVAGTSHGDVRFTAGLVAPAWSTDSPFNVVQPGSLRWASASVPVSEGAGSVTLSVIRVGGDAGTVSVNYATSSGTAVAGSDFTASSGTLTWADRDVTAKTVTFPILNDGTPESAEALTVTLSSPGGGATLGSPATVTVALNDDDSAASSGTLQFASGGYSIAEGDGSVTVTVTRVGGTAGAASVTYATGNGTAVAGRDFSASSGQLSWTPGESGGKSFQIAIAEDTLVEGSESLAIMLSSASGASLGVPASATITISDNDTSAPGGGAGGGAGSGSGGGGALDLAAALVLAGLASLRRSRRMKRSQGTSDPARTRFPGPTSEG